MWFVLPVVAHGFNTWVVPGDGTLPEVYAAAADDDTIELPAGTVTDDLPELQKRLTIFGQGAASTTLQLPDRAPSVRVHVNTTFSDLTLDGLDRQQMLELVGTAVLTLTDAVLDGGSAPYEPGGCVEAQSGTTVIASGTTFRGCVAAQGGAVSLVSATGSCTGCVFESNRAVSTYGGGGAVWLDGSATASFTDSVFSLNNAQYASGGAIAMTGSASLNVFGGSFDGNTALYRGGAIATRNGNAITIAPSAAGGTSFLDGAATDGGAVACEFFTTCTLGVTGASFADHTVTGRGGHVFVELGTATVADSTFERGHAIDDGGALFIGGSGSGLTVSDSVFQANDSSGQGGAVFSTSATVDLVRVALCDNLAADSGGAVYVELAPSTMVRNSTAVRNIAVDSGGALRLNGGGTVLQSTFVQNSAGSVGSAIAVRGFGAVVDIYGTVMSQHDDAIAVDTATDGVPPVVSVDRSATWANLFGDYGPIVTSANGVVLTTDPFPSLPVGCETPIPLYGGELSDQGDLIDADGSPSEIGATGGPDADPDLWISDGDPVPAMWDCDPLSPLAYPGNEEIPSDGIDNDCLDGDAPSLDTGTTVPGDTADPGGTNPPTRPAVAERPSELPGAARSTGCGCRTGASGGRGLFLALLALRRARGGRGRAGVNVAP